MYQQYWFFASYLHLEKLLQEQNEGLLPGKHATVNKQGSTVSVLNFMSQNLAYMLLFRQFKLYEYLIIG